MLNPLVRERDLLVELLELLEVVNVAKHFEHRVDVLLALKELFVEQEGSPVVNLILDDDLLVVGSVVLLVKFRALVVVFGDCKPREDALRRFREGFFDYFEVSLVNKVKCVSVPEVNFLKLAHDLIVDKAQVVLDCLVEHDVEELLAHAFGVVAESADSVSVDLVQKHVDFVNLLRPVQALHRFVLLHKFRSLFVFLSLNRGLGSL